MSEQKIKAVELKASMVQGLTPLNEVQTEYAERKINEYINRTKADYLMMLNHDVRYFTVFDNNCSVIVNYGKKIMEFIRQCVEPIYGKVKLVDADSTMGAVEIWCDGVCFMLFDYTSGVVQL